MKDYLGNEVKVGDIVIGLRGGKYNELVTQKVIKITKYYVFVELLNPKEFDGCVRPNGKYTSDQFIILNQ